MNVQLATLLAQTNEHGTGGLAVFLLSTWRLW